MFRWKVVRKEVYFRKKIYQTGELMPENFTDRDRNRNTYARRLEKVEILDERTDEEKEGWLAELEATPQPPLEEEKNSASDSIPVNTMVQSEILVEMKTPAVEVKTIPNKVVEMTKVAEATKSVVRAPAIAVIAKKE